MLTDAEEAVDIELGVDLLALLGPPQLGHSGWRPNQLQLLECPLVLSSLVSVVGVVILDVGIGVVTGNSPLVLGSC